MKKFTQNPGLPNQILSLNDKDYISFNPNPHRGSPIFGSDTGGSETMFRLDGVWLGLNGDHRAAYEAALESGGIPAAVELYTKLKPEFGSSWSTDDMSPEFFLRWVQARVLASELNSANTSHEQ